MRWADWNFIDYFSYKDEVAQKSIKIQHTIEKNEDV